APGAAFLTGMGSDRLAANIANTMAFLKSCSARPLPGAELEMMLAFNMVTPVDVRGAMLGRPTPYEATLARLRVPALVTHGEEDRVVLPAVGRYTLATVPGATGSFYEDVGHMPFWEEPERFNAELGAFVEGLG